MHNSNINPNGHTIATIPHSDGLYCVIIPNETQTSHHANAATGKMDINEAHRKLGHISPVAIKHAISKGYITRIELDKKSKPDFCKACVNAKSARQPFPKQSETHATKHGDCVHWDLWGPARVKSLNGHYYIAARLDDAKPNSTFKRKRVRQYSHTNKMKLLSKLKLETK